MPDLDAAKTRLETELAELQDRLTRLDRDLSEPPDPDSSERAVQMEDDEALEAQAALVSREIASVRRALERVEDGSYGVCTNCGDDISEQRLEVRPEAALCIDCASGKS
jgi:RNA polymerase-binding protein DksA